MNTSLPERRYPARHPHRRDHNRAVIVFATVCTKNRNPALASLQIHSLLLDCWKAANSWQVGKYVILPDHIHLFASPATLDAPSPKRWIAYWKSLATKRWPTGIPKPGWQRDAWDRQLRSGESYSAKWRYVRDNPVRHGLVSDADEWPFQGEVAALAWHD